MTRAAGAIAALVLAVLLWASTSGVTPIWHEPPEKFSAPAPPVFDATVDDTSDAIPPQEPDDSGSGSDNRIIETILLGLLAAGLVVVAIVVRGVWRLRLPPRREPEPRFAPLPDIAAAVTEDADAQFSALATGSPRNAVVACWVRLEDTVVASGLPRDPAETSSEFTARVLSMYAVTPAAIDELARLYREARFSVHEIGERHREDAVRALRRLHEDLGVAVRA
jgi:hypothetical protein